MRDMRGLVAVIALLSWGLPAVAKADVINLTCVQLDMTLITVVACTEACPTIDLRIDTAQEIVKATPSTGTDSGSFAALITDSSIDWDSEFWHYQVSRYSGLLRMSADPKHGERMLNAVYDYRCSAVQRQF